MSEKVRDKDIIARVRLLRTRFAGERGKSKFARALGLSPSTYNYYEQDRVPPVPVAIRMCELTHTPLQWLLLGEQSSVPGSLEQASKRAALLERVRFLLENYPPAGASLEAFVDFLMRRSGLRSARQGQRQEVELHQDGSDEAAREWIKKQVDVNAVVGGLPNDYMRDIDIVRYDRAGNETRRWTLHGAWIKVLEYDELEGANTDNTIEKLTISYQYWT